MSSFADRQVLNSISKAYNTLLMALAVLAGVIVLMILLLIVVDVCIRTLGFTAFNFTLGLVEYGLLYFTMFSAPYLVRQKGHIYIQTLTSMMPNPLLQIAEKMIYLLSILATAIFGYISTVLLFEKILGDEIEIRGIDFPAWLPVLPLPLCYFLVAIEFARFLIGFDSMYQSNSQTREML